MGIDLGKRIKKSWRTLGPAGAFALGAAALVAASCAPGGAGKKDNVVLIIIDTIRADRLGCYGYPAPTSPNIDALASEGALFRQAVTSAPVTLPSVSSILTSTYPATHNVKYNGKFFLPEASVTLAETLKENGYRTAAFIGGFPLDSIFKIDQGFDVYDDDFSASAKKLSREWIGHGVSDFERSAAEVNEKVFEWLEGVGKDNFFLMAHYFDPHTPRDAPSPYAEKFRNAYDAEVSYTDEHVGRLLDKLEELGLKENTLIVLTGDHGESLGDHGEPTHGNFLFDTTMLVPLILRREGRIPAGLSVDSMVKTIDIMPTILDLLEIPAGPRSQGTSLLRALDGEPFEGVALMETMLSYYEVDAYEVPSIVKGLRTSQWKAVYVVFKRDGKHHSLGQLFNIEKDPRELFDVREKNKETFMRLILEMNSIDEACSARAIPVDNRIEMDEDTRRKLRDLGYLN